MIKNGFERIVENMTEDQMYSMMPQYIEYNGGDYFVRRNNGYFRNCGCFDEYQKYEDRDITLVDFPSKPKQLLLRLFYNNHLPDYPR